MPDFFEPLAEFAVLLRHAADAGWRADRVSYGECGCPTRLVMKHPEKGERDICGPEGVEILLREDRR